MSVLLLVLSQTIVYALLLPLYKKANQSFSPFAVIAIATFSLFAASFILSVFLENTINWKYLSAHRNIVFLLFGIGLLNALGFWLYILTFKYMPIWQQSMFALLVPVFSGIFAYFILGEALSLKLFAGLAIMSIGLFIAIR